MRKEIFLGFTNIMYANYYLNPDLIFPEHITKEMSYSAIVLKPQKVIRKVREYSIRAYENLKKIL